MLTIFKNKYDLLFEKIPQNAKICLWGCGPIAMKLKNKLEKTRKDVRVLFFIDSYKIGECCGIKIYPPSSVSEIKSEIDLVIITSVSSKKIIEEKLQKFPDISFISLNWRFLSLKDKSLYLARNLPACFNTKQKQIKACWRYNKEYDYEKNLKKRATAQKEFADKYFIPYLNEEDDLLDIGCADGWFDFYIAEHVKNIDAFDISSQFLNTAKKIQHEKNIKNISFNIGDLLSIAPSKTYRCLTLLGITQYVLKDKDFEKIIHKLSKSLKKGSKIMTKDLLTTEETFGHSIGIYHYTCRNQDYYQKVFADCGFSLDIKENIDSCNNGTGKNCFLTAFVFTKN